VEVGGCRNGDVGVVHGSRQNGFAVETTCPDEKSDTPPSPVNPNDDTIGFNE